VRVFVTGGTGHSGSYIIPELIAAGQVTGLARSDTAAVALGAKVRPGDLEDLDGLKEAAAGSDGVIHVAHRQDLLASGGMDAVAAAELPIMLAYGEALAETGKPLVAAGSIGSPGQLGRPVTEEDPALPVGDEHKGTLRVRNIVETAVIGLAERGVRSSVVRIANIAHSTTDRAGFLPTLIALAKDKGFAGYPGDGGTRCTPAMSPPCFVWRWRRGRPTDIGTRLGAGRSRSARSPRPSAAAWACPPSVFPRTN
jgi:nucleoside-diphosphate-sugar epimerase